MNKYINILNNSKLFYGIMMMLMNLTSRYIDIDLESHKIFFKSVIIRRLAIFTIAFIATRDIYISVIITILYIILVLHLFNIKSKYCILPQYIKNIDYNNDGVISIDEIKKAYNILKKSGKYKLTSII